MHTFFTILAAAGALQMPTNDTAFTTVAPIAVSTCSVSELVSPAAYAEFGPSLSYYSLALSFTNTDDVDATQVVFDIVEGTQHQVITDRGHFRRGVRIERNIGEYTGALRSLSGPAACSVASVTFADGRRWTAQGGVASTMSSR